MLQVAYNDQRKSKIYLKKVAGIKIRITVERKERRNI